MSSGLLGKCVVHKVFLIRHGETVDNVAGLYAGTRDSALTNHGVIQASRLGEYLAQDGVRFTHLFSSTLTRASNTAEAILTAQIEAVSPPRAETLDGIKKLNDLMEQDFGSLEGKPFTTRLRSDNTVAAYDGTTINDGTFKAAESKESMTHRANRFLSGHLNPILQSSQRAVVGIVSHGMLLSSLWRCILKQQPPSSVTLHPELLAENAPTSLEHLGGWMNTGYLELEIQHDSELGSSDFGRSDTTIGHDHLGLQPGAPSIAVEHEKKDGSDSLSENLPDNNALLSTEVPEPAEFTVRILVINGRQHLSGLKRTRGGVGSSRHDSTQRSIHSFFKKPKTS